MPVGLPSGVCITLVLGGATWVLFILLCRLLGLEAAYIFMETSDEVTWKCTRLKLSASLEQVVVKEHTQTPQ